MIDLVCNEAHNFEAYILGAVLILEYWLGRTEKTKSGSTIELILKTLASFGRALIKKRG